MRRLVPLILVALALGLAACGPSDVVLRKPATGEIAECSSSAIVASVIDDTEACAAAYAQQGFQQQVP